MQIDKLPQHQPQHFHSYMHDIGNLRSHHWKHWMDIYENCAYDCQYCVYRSGDKMGKIQALVNNLDAFRAEVAALESPGIVYLGPKADVYQPQEKRLGLTRAVLENFAESGIPTFIVTRSELLLRDMDLFKSMADAGLVELSISIASPQAQPELEPNTPSVAARLELISELRRNGIPVSVHMSPIIPYLDSADSLQQLMLDINARGADCIYACMLGMAERYANVVQRAFPHEANRQLMMRTYEHGNQRLDIVSPNQAYVLETMGNLSTFAATQAIPFACVHIPEFDITERTGHIFRFKLPNVGDMTRHFTRTGQQRINWQAMLDYLAPFPAVDDAFRSSVRRFWDEGILFKNTYFQPVQEGAGLTFQRRAELDLRVTNMRVEANVHAK